MAPCYYISKSGYLHAREIAWRRLLLICALCQHRVMGLLSLEVRLNLWQVTSLDARTGLFASSTLCTTSLRLCKTAHSGKLLSHPKRSSKIRCSESFDSVILPLMQTSLRTKSKPDECLPTLRNFHRLFLKHFKSLQTLRIARTPPSRHAIIEATTCWLNCFCQALAWGWVGWVGGPVPGKVLHAACLLSKQNGEFFGQAIHHKCPSGTVGHTRWFTLEAHHPPNGT